MDYIINKVVTLGTGIFSIYALILIFRKQWLQLILLILGLSILFSILQNPLEFFKSISNVITKEVLK